MSEPASRTGRPRLLRRPRGKPLRYLQRIVNQRVYDYPHRNLLAIGQPKSGSTWLFRMLASVPGYLPRVPSTVKIWSNHDLRRDEFIPAPVGYTVSKVHTSPTDENLAIIRATERPYVVLIRDPRDLAVSWAYYVVQALKAPFPDEVRALPIDERIAYYIENVLPRTSRWAVDWSRRLDSTRGLLIRYEELLADPVARMTTVFAHFELGLGPELVQRIVERHAFRRATGRAPGEADPASFNRKGIAGDWRNHFTDAHVAAFERVAGDAMRELGYDRGPVAGADQRSSIGT